MKIYILTIVVGILFIGTVRADVRIKELVRFEGSRSQKLVGYGVVVGLSGTGDSRNNKTTARSIGNILSNFNLSIEPEQIKSRNVAAVMITAELPAYSIAGDKIDVHVSSIGDATSLYGGTLLLAPLNGTNDEIYALAQGQLAVGGYRYDYNGNSYQKNHSTVGVVSGGATVERDSVISNIGDENSIKLILNEADFTTANRIINVLKQNYPRAEVHSSHPGKVTIKFRENSNLFQTISDIELLTIKPDSFARVVVNERTGTVVFGANVKVDDVVISQGNLKISISTNYEASQPNGIYRQISNQIGTAIIANSDIEVTESYAPNIAKIDGSTIGDLVDSLNSLKISTRDLISILQAIEKSGALHGELIIQ